MNSIEKFYLFSSHIDHFQLGRKINLMGKTGVNCLLNRNKILFLENSNFNIKLMCNHYSQPLIPEIQAKIEVKWILRNSIYHHLLSFIFEHLSLQKVERASSLFLAGLLQRFNFHFEMNIEIGVQILTNRK